MTFSRLLIANRGEIAVRIIRTARSLGYDTIAVYSDTDAQALHVREADEAVCIGAAPAIASYLNNAALLEAARRTGAQAIHPGYGFLSENAAFARACEDAGLVFVGPPADAIELMGSKRLSKIAMHKAGVPTVPGYEGEDQSDSRMCAEAARIGYPVMIKASAGGGGRGMRRVDDPATLVEHLARARSESRSAFGSDELILEKAIVAPRHIEVQVFADRQGQVIHLGERDCSIQRRHQKVVEEAPSPFVDGALRQALGEAAVAAARACRYEGAGTVEFLVDDQRRFYFLEMNTRLQVEHPVTECVTGQDLVAWQLAVAAGRPLPLGQADIPLVGHAIEVRLYAEDPAHDYIPQTGRVIAWAPYTGDGVRIDSGIAAGTDVSAHYDPLLAKLIAWGPDRETARRRLRRALGHTLLAGVNSNRQFLAEVLDHPHFMAGLATTDFLDGAFQGSPSLAAEPADPQLLAMGALLCYRALTLTNGRGQGWSNSLASATALELEVGGERQTVMVLPQRGGDGDSYRVSWAQQPTGLKPGDIQLTVIAGQNRNQRGELDVRIDGITRRCRFVHWDDKVHCQFQGQNRSLLLADRTNAAPVSEAVAGDGQVLATMDGTVISVEVETGMSVQQGQVIVVLEAMKMEHPLRANADGVVEAVHVQAGAQVRQRQNLVSIRPESRPSEHF